MPTGETSPWARGAPGEDGTAGPPAGDGSWGASLPQIPSWSPQQPAYPPSGPPASPPWGAPPWGAPPWGGETWAPQQPWAGPGTVSDEQLRRLPPPPAGLLGEQRPAVVGLAVTLAVTASLLWVCGLSLFLLVAAAGTRALGPAGEDGVLFHLLDDVVLRMGDGLWVPLYGFPVASLVTGFCLLARRTWTRLAHTAVGAVALGWAFWWLNGSPLTWVVVALYVGVAVGVLWVPSANRWYGRRAPRRPAGVQLTG